MRELGHDHIDLLKLDIEGAEFAVLEKMTAESVRPKIICVLAYPNRAVEGPADSLN